MIFGFDFIGSIFRVIDKTDPLLFELHLNSYFIDDSSHLFFMFTFSNCALYVLYSSLCHLLTEFEASILKPPSPSQIPFHPFTSHLNHSLSETKSRLL